MLQLVRYPDAQAEVLERVPDSVVGIGAGLTEGQTRVDPVTQRIAREVANLQCLLIGEREVNLVPHLVEMDVFVG